MQTVEDFAVRVIYLLRLMDADICPTMRMSSGDVRSPSAWLARRSYSCFGLFLLPGGLSLRFTVPSPGSLRLR
jgi:hypothetical protein